MGKMLPSTVGFCQFPQNRHLVRRSRKREGGSPQRLRKPLRFFLRPALHGLRLPKPVFRVRGMRYLDSKNDFTFHKVFEQHPHLLKSFLNALLPLEPVAQI